MSLLVLALLVGLWSAILLPGAIRSYRDSSPATSVESFQRAMWKLQTRALLGRDATHETTAPAGAAGLSTRERALQRRRTVLRILSAGLVASTVGLVTVGRVFGWVLAADALVLATYLLVLRVLRARAEEARRKIAMLPSRPPAAQPHRDALDTPQAAGDSG